jgi:excisionase family DNA binding protein
MVPTPRGAETGGDSRIANYCHEGKSQWSATCAERHLSCQGRVGDDAATSCRAGSTKVRHRHQDLKYSRCRNLRIEALHMLSLPRLFTEAEVAKALGCSRETVRCERCCGRLGFTKLGSRIRFTEQQIAQYLEHQAHAPCPIEKTDELNGHWLSQRPNSPVWCRTWFDKRTRQTRRITVSISQAPRQPVTASPNGRSSLPAPSSRK